MELVRDTFMDIEQPENPILHRDDDEPQTDIVTIGDFYREIINTIKKLGGDIFTGDPSLQVAMNSGFPIDQLFPIKSGEEAIQALEWIIEEGEGTLSLPFDNEGEPAHYYRFEEIVEGHRLVEDPDAEHGFSYTGPKIRFHPEDIWDFPDNRKAANYPEGTEERLRVDTFNAAYSDILRVMHEAFNGNPKRIEEAVFLMGGLRRIARNVVSFTDSETGKQCGLTYEFVADSLMDN